MNFRRAIRGLALLLNAFAVLYWLAMLAWSAQGTDSWRRFLDIGTLIFLVVVIAPVFSLIALLWKPQASS
jgi:hypothetical protein